LSRFHVKYFRIRERENELHRESRDAKEAMINCKDLLRINAENGREKMPHCNAMIRECIGYVEEILRAKGKLK